MTPSPTREGFPRPPLSPPGGGEGCVIFQETRELDFVVHEINQFVTYRILALTCLSVLLNFVNLLRIILVRNLTLQWRPTTTKYFTGSQDTAHRSDIHATYA